MNPGTHREFPEKFLVPTPSVAKDLMPRDIMSSEPRHWMVFGQLVMPVQCCAGARRRRVLAQRCTGMTLSLIHI